MLSALLCHIMRLWVPRGDRGVDVSTGFSYFELGGIYVLSYRCARYEAFGSKRG